MIGNSFLTLSESFEYYTMNFGALTSTLRISHNKSESESEYIKSESLLILSLMGNFTRLPFSF